MKNTIKQPYVLPKNILNKQNLKKKNNIQLNKQTFLKINNQTTERVNPEYYVLRVSISKIR